MVPAHTTNTLTGFFLEIYQFIFFKGIFAFRAVARHIHVNFFSYKKKVSIYSFSKINIKAMCVILREKEDTTKSKWLKR
jgi:hypothetical protein